MNRINKGILLPIIALVALFLKQAFGYELSTDQIDVIVDGLLAVTALLGILMQPKKDEKEKDVI